MQRAEAGPGTTFSQPIRAITTMLLVCILVGAGVWLIHRQIEDILFINPVLNGFIAFVFLFGVVTCFWQVWTLAQSVSWIEAFVRREPGADEGTAPSLLAPLAALLKSRGRALTISASSGRSILDSVAQRLDEARDITRYLINLLVFLGLLGTFWGLATTVPAVVETIRSLAPAPEESGIDIFGQLLSGLENQLGGMGTAFSSSLLGLGGSVTLGLLELFAGHGQNRFYRELEEWVSSITRIGLSDGEGGGDQGAVVQVLDHMAGQMESLQMLFTQADVARSVMEDRVNDLAGAVDRLAARLADGAMQEGANAAALARVAEGQERLVAALSGLTPGEGGGGGVDAESRMRLRSIDVQMLRILEEISAGRQETVSDLRADLAALTAAIRQLSRAAPSARG
ncbi:biopolymer transporter ExbB [Pseudogemmobacter sonorensis]|uniref:biopolymer transporter ExbB n=1 Tax=Pseudogemmobacter sonorensis TaxID=2989681 RepID=UPI0036D0AE08